MNDFKRAFLITSGILCATALFLAVAFACTVAVLFYQHFSDIGTYVQSTGIIQFGGIVLLILAVLGAGYGLMSWLMNRTYGR